MKNKILLLMVEGVSEETALGDLFHYIYGDRVEIDVLAYDITAEKAKKGIARSLIEKVNKYLNLYSLKKKDIYKIIQIIDLDGAYADDSDIIENPNIKKAIYLEDKIEAKDREQLIIRNERKRHNIDDMNELTGLDEIPYSVYYMSCNLDHVLHNKPNNDNREKRKDARKLNEKYKNNMEGYKNLLCSSDFSVILGYKESWEFIKKDNNSLKRYTNIGIALNPKE